MFGSQIQASQADEEQCNFYQQFLSATHISKTEYKGEFAFKKIKDVRYRFAKGTHKKVCSHNPFTQRCWLLFFRVPLLLRAWAICFRQSQSSSYKAVCSLLGP